MEAEAVRRSWAAKRGIGSQASATVDEHIDRADLLGAFQACDIDGNGKIGAIELHAILQAIGAEVTLASVVATVAEAERLTEQDEIHAAAAVTVAAAPPPTPSPAANASHNFSRPFAALTMVTDAARDVGAQVTGIAETVATAVVEAAEEAAEYTGLMPVAAESADRHDGQLDFAEFTDLMEGPLLEPLFEGLASPRELARGDDDGDQSDADVAADTTLLSEHGLEEHRERLHQGNWLGRLDQATADDLQRIGLPVLQARTLVHAAGLTPMARARKRVGVRCDIFRSLL
jgi:ribosomal protein L12E/L44/L45/RPP1/RPP2